jgi:hypothetical protein
VLFRSKGSLLVGGTVNINLLPVRVKRYLNAVYLIGGVADPLVVGELENDGKALRVVAGDVVRTVTYEDVLVVVNPLDNVVVALLGHVLGYAGLVLGDAPLLEVGTKVAVVAEPERDRVVEEVLGLGLEELGLVRIDHI